MVETLFVQLGSALVNISKVRALTPHRDNDKTFVFFEGPTDGHNPMLVDCSMAHASACLAETYQQMAMMQAAANKAYGSKGNA